MFQFIAILLVLFRPTTGSPIQNYGRYFYADFLQDSTYGMHYITLTIGSQNQPLKVYVTTSESVMGVFTDKCTGTLGKRFNES